MPSVQGGQRGVAVVEELGLQRDLPGDRGSRILRCSAADRGDHGSRGAGLGDNQQPLAGQQVVQHHGLDRLGVVLPEAGLLLSGVTLAARLVKFVLELGGGLVEQVVRGTLQFGGAEHDPDGQSQEHGHDGYQVVTKVDH